MQISEEQLSEIESVANTLRGMTFDPRLQEEFKGYILEQVQKLDSVTFAVNVSQYHCPETKDMLDAMG